MEENLSAGGPSNPRDDCDAKTAYTPSNYSQDDAEVHDLLNPPPIISRGGYGNLPADGSRYSMVDRDARTEYSQSVYSRDDTGPYHAHDHSRITQGNDAAFSERRGTRRRYRPQMDERVERCQHVKNFLMLKLSLAGFAMNTVKLVEEGHMATNLSSPSEAQDFEMVYEKKLKILDLYHAAEEAVHGEVFRSHVLVSPIVFSLKKSIYARA